MNAAPIGWTMEGLKHACARQLRSSPCVRIRPYLGSSGLPSQRNQSRSYSHQRRSVRGQSAIVTGSSRGIGRAVALRLAADGYNVCINDVAANEEGCGRVAEEIEAMGGKACVALADVSQMEQVARMVQTAVEKLGPLKTMVANAAIMQLKPVLEVTEADFERMFAVNVFGLRNCYDVAAKQMIQQGTCGPEDPGKLIGAASIAAFKPGLLQSHYSASKWAVRGLTHAYALEIAPHHITVNAYAPGIVGTAMWDVIDAHFAKLLPGEPGGEAPPRVTAIRATALRRESVPEDVARHVSFLASSDSDFITGQTQVVDGGIVYT